MTTIIQVIACLRAALALRNEFHRLVIEIIRVEFSQRF